MTLATRCTACHTAFRVVQDQLKVSDGWVRCGRCNEVFDAGANLIDLDQAQAIETTSALANSPSALANEERHPTVPLPHIVTQGDTSQPPSFLAAELEEAEAAATAHAEPALQAVDIDLAHEAGTDAAATQAAVVATADVTPPEPVVGLPAAIADDLTAATLPEPDLRADVLPTPGFVRQADRAARWQTRGVRIALALASLALLLVLAVQLLVWQRDVIAAHWKEARPALVTLCQWADCQVQPLRRVDQISVASSGLTRIEGSSLHRFNVSLLNRGGTELMVPAIDLSLTDAQGQVISRRVLAASELGITATVVPPGAELPLQAMLSTGSRKVAGYTIELFYP